MDKMFKMGIMAIIAIKSDFDFQKLVSVFENLLRFPQTSFDFSEISIGF